MNSHEQAAAIALARVQETCKSLWSLVTCGRSNMSYEDRYVITAKAANEMDANYGYRIRSAVEKLVNTGDCGLSEYLTRITASDMVREALIRYGVEFCPWVIAESHQLPRLVAEANVVAIEKGFDCYSETIVIKTPMGKNRIHILKHSVDRAFRILFFPNREACRSELVIIASWCKAKRATLIEDSDGLKFIAVDDPAVNICNIKAKWAASWSVPWIEAVVRGKTAYKPLSHKQGYYRTLKRIMKVAKAWYDKEGCAYSAAKKAVRGVKINGKDVETPAVLARIIEYVKYYQKGQQNGQ